ncbi:MAG: hypothetical protein JNN04_04530 [Cyclobacteriaceae bacterium]|nr:hypothetical protein [Cyclobacteriaceae bacterium]
MKTSKALKKPYRRLLSMGLWCGIIAMGLLLYTWDKELSRGELSLIVGFFALGVSLALNALDRRQEEQSL